MDETQRKDALLAALLPDVPFDGWSLAAMRAAAQRVGMDAVELATLFPRGPRDAVAWFSDWADRLTLAIDRVAGEALSLTLEDSLTGGRVATDPLAHDSRTGEAADVRNQLPYLVGSELREGGHGRAVDAVADVQEELAIGVAVAEKAGGQGRATVAVRAGPVARLAGAVVEASAGRYGRAVSGHGIGFAFERVLGEEQAGETEERGQRDQGFRVGSHQCCPPLGAIE